MAVVLVVEDDDMIRDTLADLLEAEGYKVLEATNGREALATLRTCPQPPCIIVLDLMMPVMDGLEFRRHQLQDPSIADVPVAIITGRDDMGDLQRLRPRVVLKKPFPLQRLAEVIGAHCDAD